MGQAKPIPFKERRMARTTTPSSFVDRTVAVAARLADRAADPNQVLGSLSVLRTLPHCGGKTPWEIAYAICEFAHRHGQVDLQLLEQTAGVPISYSTLIAEQALRMALTPRGSHLYTITNATPSPQTVAQLANRFSGSIGPSAVPELRNQMELQSRYNQPQIQVYDLDPGRWATTNADGTTTPEVEKPKKKEKQRLTIDSVVISAEIKEQINAAISQKKYADLIFDTWGFGEVFEKGTAISLLFYGVPGTGKTLMAQAIAEEMGAELKIYGTAEIQSSEPGGAERMIQTIFKEASELWNQLSGKKRVILFDECDSLLMNRQKVGAIMAAQINALLSEIEKYAGVVIFTTNRLGKLDPALERRLTDKIEFPFPNEEARELIWKRLIPKDAPIADDVNFAKLARIEIAGGNIKNAVLNAARMAAYRKSEKITLEHFKEAVAKEMASIESFNQSAKEGEQWTEVEGQEMVDGQSIELKRGEKFETKPITATGGSDE